MDIALVLAQIIALLSLTALCLYAIVVLVRVNGILDTVGKDLKELSAKAVPVLENLEIITTRVRAITESIEDQVISVGDSFTAIRRVADDILDLERRVQHRVEGPILETVGYLLAVIKGVRTFLERVRS